MRHMENRVPRNFRTHYPVNRGEPVANLPLRPIVLQEAITQMDSENPRVQNRAKKRLDEFHKSLGPHTKPRLQHHTKENPDKNKVSRLPPPANKSTSRIPSPTQKQTTSPSTQNQPQKPSPDTSPQPLPSPTLGRPHPTPPTPPHPLSILTSLLIAISFLATILLAIALIISNGNIRLFFA